MLRNLIFCNIIKHLCVAKGNLIAYKLQMNVTLFLFVCNSGYIFLR